MVEEHDLYVNYRLFVFMLFGFHACERIAQGHASHIYHFCYSSCIMSEERLIEDMLEGTRKDIQRLAREVKVNATGSKLDIINRVKASLGKDNSTFNKVFKNDLVALGVG